jgi:hypothetical protein
LPEKVRRAVLGIERNPIMAFSKYTLYKYVKVAATWRYCKAA